MRRYRVRFSREAMKDLVRLTEFLVDTAPELAVDAEATIADAVLVLQRLPFSGRPVRESPSDAPDLRELIIPLGQAGYVLLYRIGPGREVSVLAARHQWEEQYH